MVNHLLKFYTDMMNLVYAAEVPLHLSGALPRVHISLESEGLGNGRNWSTCGGLLYVKGVTMKKLHCVTEISK